MPDECTCLLRAAEVGVVIVAILVLGGFVLSKIFRGRQ